MHRVRDRLVQRRTSLINEIRGFLLERGITFAAKSVHLRNNPPLVIEDVEQNLSPRMRWLLQRMCQEWKQMEIDIEAVTDEIESISNEEASWRLRQIPGSGPLVSTATVAAIGNGAACRRGRDFAAWVGVVPRQYSTGGKQKLLGISKRGNRYLRRMLIYGARAVLLRVKYDTGGFGQWVHRLEARAPRNKVIVADRQKAGSHRLGRAISGIGLSTSAAANGCCLIWPWKIRYAWKAQSAFDFSTATTTAVEQSSTTVC